MDSTADTIIQDDKVKTLSDIPGPKPKFILGNITEFSMATIHKYVAKVAKEYGSIALIKIGPKPFVIISNPDTLRTILKQRPDKFGRISTIATVFESMGLLGLFSSEGEAWKRQRQLVMPGFKPALVKAFYPTMVETSNKLSAVISSSLSDDSVNVPFDIQLLFKKFTTDITTKLAFGGDFDCLQADDTVLQTCLKVIMPMINSRLKSPFPLWRYIKLPKDYALDRSIKTVKRHLKDFIESAKVNLVAGAEPSNILESMILASDDEGDGFTEDELFGNAMTLMLAGEDTTSNTLAWAVHYLAKDQELQEEVYQEIKHNLSGRVPTWEELDSFPLTYACLQEAMRIKPVVPFGSAGALQDVVIEGYAVPKGTPLMLLINYEGHNDETFPEPDKFDPKRWIELPQEKIKSNEKASMPFGGGARICPSRALSIMEMKAALITILSDFRFTHHNGVATTDDCVEFTLVPKNLKVNVFRREV
jgi:cytochrome P450